MVIVPELTTFAVVLNTEKAWDATMVPVFLRVPPFTVTFPTVTLLSNSTVPAVGA